MTEHAAPLAVWRGAVEKALQDGAVDAVPVILVRMARDGWGAEAEDLRRRFLGVSSWMAERPSGRVGRDPEAAKQVAVLVTAIRRGGLPVLRDVVDGLQRIAAPEAFREILVEAIARVHDRQAEDDFDRAEAADEAFRDARR